MAPCSFAGHVPPLPGWWLFWLRITWWCGNQSHRVCWAFKKSFSRGWAISCTERRLIECSDTGAEEHFIKKYAISNRPNADNWIVFICYWICGGLRFKSEDGAFSVWSRSEWVFTEARRPNNPRPCSSLATKNTRERIKNCDDILKRTVVADPTTSNEGKMPRKKNTKQNTVEKSKENC